MAKRVEKKKRKENKRDRKATIEQSTFEKNLSALLGVNPLLAAKVLDLKENVKFEVFQGKDPVDINIVEIETGAIFYKQPIEDVLKQYQNIEDTHALNPYLYFFGFGNGVLMKMLANSEQHTRVTILEPEIEIIYIVFNLIDFSKEIANKKLEVLYTADFNFAIADTLINFKDAKIYGRTYSMELVLDFYAKYKDDILKVNADLLKAINHVIVGHGNDAVDSLVGIEHHTKNIPVMCKNVKFKDFVHKRNTETAIVVSTGPSLAKQLPLLKEIAPYVTLISVDASLPILAKHGIKPDIVTSIERVELTAKFFENTPEEFQEDIVFVCASLQHEKVLKSIKRGQKVITMRPFRYSRFFEMDDYGYVGLGMSSANMAHELAYLMGFSSCVLIGQDLAYGKDGKSHSSGHTFGEDEVKHKEDDELVLAYGGDEQIRTTKIWKMFLNFFEKTSFEAREKMKTINSTEGGARIGNTLEISFQDICDNIDKSRTKPSIKLEKPTKEQSDEAFKQANEKIDLMLEVGDRVKSKAEEVFVTVADVCVELEKLNAEQKLDSIDFEKLTKILDDIDEVKALFENDLDFVNIYFYTIQSYIVHQELELAKIRVSNPKDEMGRKVKMVDWIMKHKYWLFSLAGGISAQMDVIKRARDAMLFDVE